ncbi:Cofilin/actin-depolymerizing factor-like [Stylophora pistillata]|uniref:Cofilin/actin-depolymerizing factor-like n=1 Tax=Stylophora pistillata TaxID=50429 RepID=A0A2B4SUG2_STYPI|nr:Cofilin/actin-depolymerizing factor-like [Stylophora pistillata]
MSSGVVVDQTVIEAFNDIKLKKRHAYVVMMIKDKKKIVVESLGDKLPLNCSQSRNEDIFKGMKKAFGNEPRYILFDFCFTRPNQTTAQKLAFISWELFPKNDNNNDDNRVTASNQFALPVLAYLMWTQHWPVTELRSIDREARKIICENGGKHPLSSTAMLYLPRDKGGRGLRSVQQEYKLTKIKSSIKLHQNSDPTMRLVQKFEERAIEKGFTSLIKEACKYTEELGTSLTLNYPNPSCSSHQAPNISISGKKVKGYLRKSVTEKLLEEVKCELWHRRFLCATWQDKDLSGDECFNWLRDWKSAPTHTITGLLELYEQLTPTRVYTKLKTGTSQGETTCKLSGGATETLTHVLAWCPALAQSKYLDRHNAVLKVLFFEVCKELELVDSVPPWYSLVSAKPVYESSDAQAYWDVPVCTDEVPIGKKMIYASSKDALKKCFTGLNTEFQCTDPAEFQHSELVKEMVQKDRV